MGRKDLIDAARLSAPPRGGNIGRGMKVNKEEILDMYVALEQFVNQDHDKVWEMWEDRVRVIENAVKQVKGVNTEVTVPPIANQTPTLEVSWNESLVRISREELQEKLREGNPSIEVMGRENNIINITVFMLKHGQEKVVAKRLQEELYKASV
jgi:L-seryl-tRNA(Ser) seleniumtransferase